MDGLLMDRIICSYGYLMTFIIRSCALETLAFSAVHFLPNLISATLPSERNGQTAFGRLNDLYSIIFIYN